MDIHIKYNYPPHTSRENLTIHIVVGLDHVVPSGLWVETISCLFLLPEPAPAIDGVFGKDWCMDLWREEKLPHQRKETVEPAAMTSMGAQVSVSPPDCPN